MTVVFIILSPVLWGNWQLLLFYSWQILDIKHLQAHNMDWISPRYTVHLYTVHSVVCITRQLYYGKRPQPYLVLCSTHSPYFKEAALLMGNWHLLLADSQFSFTRWVSKSRERWRVPQLPPPDWNFFFKPFYSTRVTSYSLTSTIQLETKCLYNGPLGP